MLFLVIYLIGIFIYDFVDTKKYVVRNDENGKNYIIETHGKNHHHHQRRIGYLGKKKQRYQQVRGIKRSLL